MEAGRSAIAPLGAAASKGNREIVTRSVEILKKHLGSSDPETRDAAKTALSRLAKGDNALAARVAKQARHPKPTAGTPRAPQAAPIQVFGGGLPVGGRIQVQARGKIVGGKQLKITTRITTRNVNGVRDIDVWESDRQVKIHDDPNQGVQVEVTEKQGGKQKTTKYSAKSVDELKKKHPKTYSLYDQYTKQQPVIQANPLPPGSPRVSAALMQLDRAMRQLSEDLDHLDK